jgi:hypothetical protein
LQGQQFQPLLEAERRDLLHEALSGEVAKDHVIQITRHSRIQGSRGYRDAARYVLEQLRGYGFLEAEAFIEEFPSDGRIVYQTWQSPSGWDITSAGTRRSDYEGKDVRGKFVLATGYGGAVHRLAVLEFGAAAVVCYLDDDRAREFPDMLAYTGMWPRSEELERVTFGFNLTNRQGESLRSMVESGQRVVLHGSASGIGLESYFMDVVVVHIEGAERPDEELVFSAHLDHPKESANDNASGSAALLDIARTLRQLIDSGRLPRPKRSIRFLWVPEWYGTMAYIDAHPDMIGPALGGSTLANINMDMVGEHLELLHSRMIMTRTPASIPSALNDVAENMAEMVDRLSVRTPRGSLSRFNYAVTPYSGGSDHMMFIDRKIPGMMFGHSPDYTHHTSEDTPDKVDPVELERSEIIATATVLYLSDLSEEEAVDLAYLVGANAAGRLGAAARRAGRLRLDGMSADRALFEAQNTVRHAALGEREAVRSVLHFNDTPAVRAAVEAADAQLAHQEESLLTALREVGMADVTQLSAELALQDTRVPRRTTRGPLDFGLPVSQLPPDAAAWYSSPEFTLNGSQRFELVNFIDGVRTVTGIRDALAAEYGPVSYEVVKRYVEDLIEVGVVRWK